MDNLLDIYTRLKLKVGNEIIVTYYTKDGTKHTEETYLSDIIHFSHIWITKNKKQTISIPFFSPETIIESITFKGNNQPTYFNPYLQQLKSSNPFDYYNQLELLMQPIINYDKEALKQRKRRIKQYLARKEYVVYDDLFFSQKQKEEFESLFNMLIKELKEYAKANGFDSNLRHIYTGTTSIVYEIGDKIIKIGKPRRTPTIPYCEYILQPIINRTFEFDGYPIHLEVTQKVLTFDNEDGYNQTSEDEHLKDIASQLKTNLELIGLSFIDLIPANIGILLKDNKIHFTGITFDTANDEVTSIQNNNSLKILPKDSQVILDLDCLEIKDQKKYSRYLKRIGLNKRKMKK